MRIGVVVIAGFILVILVVAVGLWVLPTGFSPFFADCLFPGLFRG